MCIDEEISCYLFYYHMKRVKIKIHLDLDLLSWEWDFRDEQTEISQENVTFQLNEVWIKASNSGNIWSDITVYQPGTNENEEMHIASLINSFISPEKGCEAQSKASILLWLCPCDNNLA